MDTNCVLISRPTSLLQVCLAVMLCTTCESFYRKPYDAAPAATTASVLIPPRPQTTPRPRPPVKATSAGSPGSHTMPPDVKKGGNSDPFSTGWGVEFNIWVWVDVKPKPEKVIKWHFKTTTVPSVEVVEWFTEAPKRSWGSQVKSLDDIQAELLGSGNVWECSSWGQECDMDKTLTDSLYGGDYGAMRSVGGGTDGTDGTLIAFIVIAALIGGGIGGVIYFQRRDVASLTEGEGEGDYEPKEKLEPEPESEPIGEDEKEAEEPAD